MIIQFPVKAGSKAKGSPKAESKSGSDTGSFFDSDFDIDLPDDFDYEAFGWYLDELIWSVEHFYGKFANMDKIRLYQEVEADVKRFAQQSAAVVGTKASPPNRRSQYASLYIDLGLSTDLTREDLDMLRQIAFKAGNICMVGTVSGIRLSFTIEHTWE